MSAQHTPTPWSVIDNSWEVSTVYGPDDEILAECPISGDVTEETQFEHEAVKDANARFIVRAVNCHDDLLGAAELALKVIDDDPSVDDWDAACDIIRAAVAKARGTVPTLDKGDM